MSDLIRASSLLGFDELVRDLGGDPQRLLDDAHLAPGPLGDAEAYVPFRSVARLVEATAVSLRCPDFGLRLATRQSIEILGPIALIARHSANSAEALEGIAEHLHIYSPALGVALEPVSPTVTRFTFSILISRLGARVQVNELGLGVSLGVFRLLAGGEFHPVTVALPHSRVGTPASYRRFFGCPVRFDAEYCGFDVETAVLMRRRSSDDPQVRDHITRYLESAEGSADADTLSQVRSLIVRTLSTRHATMATVSAHLGVHPRTLQRWLAKDGTTFEAVLDEVRRERAEHYLNHSRLSIEEVSAMLGYSQQSCLSRASTRWFGVSPRTFRSSVDDRTGKPGPGDLDVRASNDPH
jgi:AraC-like DNA-binding protein